MSQVPSPPPPGFPPNPPASYQNYAAPDVKQANGLAIASFVCGLLGCLAITPFIGIILGALGVKDARKKGGSGRGLAIAGIVLSILWIGAGVLFAGSIAALVGMSKQERQLAAAFARDVAAGNVDAAMARTTSSVKREEVAAAAAKLQPLGNVTDTTMFGVSGQANASGKFWMIAGAVTFNKGQGVGYAAKVVDQGGVPKIDGFTFTVNNVTAGGGNAPTPTPTPTPTPAPNSVPTAVPTTPPDGTSGH
jgi:hypothetical protein